jgi:heme/copper-type cytochrome/quinol oxidase subunit 1
MPRRVPDFPDILNSWNYISSIGSGITLISFFLLVVFFKVILDPYIDDNHEEENWKGMSIGYSSWLSHPLALWAHYKTYLGVIHINYVL